MPERGRGNWVFPRGGKQAFAKGENVRNRGVSKEWSEANEMSARAKARGSGTTHPYRDEE